MVTNPRRRRGCRASSAGKIALSRSSLSHRRRRPSAILGLGYSLPTRFRKAFTIAPHNMPPQDQRAIRRGHEPAGIVENRSLIKRTTCRSTRVEFRRPSLSLSILGAIFLLARPYAFQAMDVPCVSGSGSGRTNARAPSVICKTSATCATPFCCRLRCVCFVCFV